MKINIEKIIQKYLDYYPEERYSLTKLIELVKHNQNSIANLFNRKNIEGHIVASGYIYSLNDDKLLLLEHKSLNKFLQPGGHIEKEDKELILAARREVQEETGLKDLENINIEEDINVPFDINSHFIPTNEKKQEEGHFHHDFRYLFVVDDIEDVKIDYNESNSYKWVNIESLLNDDIYGLSIKKIVHIINNIKNKLTK